MRFGDIWIVQNFQRDIRAGNDSEAGQKCGGRIRRSRSDFQNTPAIRNVGLADLMKRRRSSDICGSRVVIAFKKSLRTHGNGILAEVPGREVKEMQSSPLRAREHRVYPK